MKIKILLPAFILYSVINSISSCSFTESSLVKHESHRSKIFDSGKNQPINYVNPFIGTRYFGHTFPGASLPWAMVHVSPDCSTKGWTYAAGYNWSDNTIMGFSHTHYSGVGMTSGGDILFQPVVNNNLQIVPGSKENPNEGYRSRFDHSDEIATPGYYSVFLKDYNIKAELTTTKRVAFHRYTFPETNNAGIIIDLGHQIGTATSPAPSRISIVNDRCVEGYKSTASGKVFFYAEFNKPCLYYGTFDVGRKTPESDSGIFPFKNGETGDKIGVFFNYRTGENEPILIKVALSFVDPEGAKKNLESEISDWDFDRVREEAGKTWDNELSKLKIEGVKDEQKEIFYTSLYHSLLAQYISQDVDGRYLGMDGKIHEAQGFDFYGSFSCWDTYRSQHPLLTIVAPEHVNDFLRSIEFKIRDFGWLPAQHFANVYRESMVGDHLVPIVVDAYLKGYRDFNAEYVYDAMKLKALERPKPPVPSSSARAGLEYYLKYGYTPVDKVTESVSNTLELAYDDWCIAQMALALGMDDDFKLFMTRALNYKNVWDKETEFMRPRKSDGAFLEISEGKEQEIAEVDGHQYYKYFDPLLVGVRPNRHYTESNAWQYIWSVQHDIKGLISLFGSNDRFNQKLDTFFEMDPAISGPKYIGVVGTIGQYVHGNQPSHHVAYLYNYSGEPWKTQRRVRQICEQLYRSGPGGLCGNEDMGSLSSWYVLSSMGLYPVTPGSTTYNIGSPVFGKVTISTANDKEFIIEAENNSAENEFIQSATLNGKPLNRPWINHEDIMKGGRLILIMGPEPNKDWGKDNPPPSLSY